MASQMYLANGAKSETNLADSGKSACCKGRRRRTVVGHVDSATTLFYFLYIQGDFFYWFRPQKVLSVEDGKIPTKKVKVRVKT